MESARSTAQTLGPAALTFDPGRRSVAIHEPGAAPRRLAAPSGLIDGTPLFPGFRLSVADVFAVGVRAAGCSTVDARGRECGYESVQPESS